MYSRLVRRAAVLGCLLASCIAMLPAQAQPAPAGATCPLVVNQPYRTPVVSTVYVVTPDCRKRPIFNPDVYFSHFADWNRVVFVETWQLNAVADHALHFLPWGPLRVFTNGSLIKTVDDPRVYLIQYEKAYPIESEAAFRSFGFTFTQVEDVDPAVLSRFTKQSSTLRSPEDAPAALAFKYANDPRVYVLKEEGGRLVKVHITTYDELKRIYRADRIATLPSTMTFENAISNELPLPPSSPEPAPTPDPSGAPTSASSAVGTNMHAVAYWSSDWVFIDQAQKASIWHGRACDGSVFDRDSLRPTLDVNGWPIRLQSGGCPVMIIMSGLDATSATPAKDAQYPPGTYVVRWEGDGDLDFFADAQDFQVTGPGRGTFRLDRSTAAGVHVELTRTNPDNPLRSLQVIMPGGVCGASRTQLDAFKGCRSARGGEGACSVGETCFDFEDVAWNRFHDDAALMSRQEKIAFHPLFLQRLQPYRAIRYMDWMATNRSSVRIWSDRATPAFQSMGTDKGVAYEYLMALSNLLKADAWFNMPHAADDDFVRRFAELARNSLDSNVKVYVEYTNEAWNDIFPQTAYVRAEGTRLGLTGGGGEGANYFVRRSRQVHDIWKSTFGSDGTRVVRVLGGFAAIPWLNDQMLRYENAAAHIDALAIAPYFGGWYGNADAEGRPNALGWSVDRLFDHITSNALPEAAGMFRDNKAIADTHGVRLFAYEGGHHLATVGGTGAYDSFVQLLHQAADHPRMEEAMLRYYQSWRSVGGELFMHFTHVGAHSVYGAWGTLERTNQPDTPGLVGIKRFIAANACWWEGCQYGARLSAPTPAPAPVPTPTPTPTPEPSPAPTTGALGLHRIDGTHVRIAPRNASAAHFIIFSTTRSVPVWPGDEVWHRAAGAYDAWLPPGTRYARACELASGSETCVAYSAVLDLADGSSTPSPEPTPEPEPTPTPTPTPSPAPAPAGARSAASTLYVGHSLMDEPLPWMIGQAARSLGFANAYDTQIGIGANLQYQWEPDLGNESGDFRAALSTGSYDSFVMIEANYVADAVQWSNTDGYALQFYDLAMSSNANMQVYLYEGWREYTRSSWRAELTSDRTHWQGIASRINAARPGSRPVRIIPGARALGHLSDAIQAGNAGGLTNISQVFSDNVHLNATGRYYMAMVQFATLYGRSPVGAARTITGEFGGNVADLSEAQARRLQELAWETVSNDAWTGVSP